MFYFIEQKGQRNIQQWIKRRIRLGPGHPCLSFIVHQAEILKPDHHGLLGYVAEITGLFQRRGQELLFIQI